MGESRIYFRGKNVQSNATPHQGYYLVSKYNGRITIHRRNIYHNHMIKNAK